MTGACNQPLCGVCGSKLVKNGRTSAGRTRWRCRSCGASTTQRRADGRCKAQARLFVRWLLEGVPVHQIGVARTSFARKTSWCWSVEVPKPLTTGEVYDQVLLDGIYLPYGWCLIIATNGRQVIAWQWCARENTAAYCALMERILAPRVVVTDGGAGIHKALKKCWPHSQVQRCLFHIRSNTITDLTRNPRTTPGATLLRLVDALSHVDSHEGASQWLVLLHEWYLLYKPLINEKTHSSEPTERTWWWTHEKLRRAYKRLEHLARAGHLFTWLNPSFAGFDIQRTTSRLEGGANAAIRRLLNTHRGLSEAHMKTSIEWLLNQKSTAPTDPVTWLVTHRQHPTKQAPQPAINPIGPANYDTAIDYDTAYQDGSLHIRKGWARR